jgi:hypothetical protein
MTPTKEQIEQLNKLASKLIYTRRNVYTEYKNIFGAECGEEIFDLLAEYANCAKCCECDRWLSLDAWDCDDLDFPCAECLMGDEDE